MWINLIFLIFYSTLFLILYTYIIYPWILNFWKIKQSKIQEKEFKDLLSVAIIISLYNEEEVIDEKMKSIFSSKYPLSKIKIYIGTDNCTDQTVPILKAWQKKYPKQIEIQEYKERRGKSAIVNDLIKKSKNFDILILTDANVFFTPPMITAFVMAFNGKYSKIGLVGGQVLFKGNINNNIGNVENLYNGRELKIKYKEGQIWGAMMGPFGACYAIRKKLFIPIPKEIIVEDFWLNMKILQKGYQTILAPSAISFELITGDANSEFKRKTRMAIGNFQNLKQFKTLLYKPWKGISFAFWSHKALRWLGPFILIVFYITSIILAFQNTFQLYLFYFLHIVLFLLLLDILMEKIKITLNPLRSIRHWLLMNIAILVGWYKYINNHSTTIWERTKRK